MYKTVTKELLDFIKNSPSCYHAIENIKKELDNDGFECLLEGSDWNLQSGKKYYVIRNYSSIIAFKVPSSNFKGFNIVSSHSDFPTFKLKENFQLEVDKKYIKLNVEKYGGMIMSTWFDRPLSIAGRVIVKKENKFETKLVDIDKDLVLIPNLAIHMNRSVNEGYSYNAQKDTLPLYSGIEGKDSLISKIAENVDEKEENILGYDLFLYNRMAPSIWGANDEFVSTPKLDDLQCAFASLKAFLEGENENTVSVLAVFDNEEVGSGTKQGADSTFLSDTLTRINNSFGRTEQDYLKAIASSFMVSADNAHALHPNYAEKADDTNRPYMNDGIVIKYNANQKYTTDAISSAIFKTICDDVDVPYQSFTNRSDIAGGSTLGNISNSHVSLNTVDIGIPQLAMHSSYETGGVKDTYYLVKALKNFFDCYVEETNLGEYKLNK